MIPAIKDGVKRGEERMQASGSDDGKRKPITRSIIPPRYATAFDLWTPTYSIAAFARATTSGGLA